MDEKLSQRRLRQKALADVRNYKPVDKSQQNISVVKCLIKILTHQRKTVAR